MARNTGTFNFAANFEGLAKAPIDARQKVGTYADLTSGATWNASGNVWLYDGAIVVVANDPDTSKNGIYYLKDAANYTGATNWVQVGTDADISTVSGQTDTNTSDIGNLGALSGITEVSLTGATNGLTKVGDNDVKLGGTNALEESTSILGGSQNLSLGTSGSKLDVFSINAARNLSVNSDANLLMSLSGGTITTSDTLGLRYTGAYENSFVDASLVSKKYVDTIATGLHPHDVVLVATTANITLSGTSTIDGVAVNDGDRVLVKDQTSGSENGIYVVTGGTWSRAVDFDGNLNGEVVNGDLIPVESGSTYANTIWVLTTPDPIDVGTDALEFTLFSRLLGVSGGDGIAITPIGSTQEIAVDLVDSGSGLVLTGGELTINSTIAGSGLTWNAGVLDVNVSATAISGTTIDVKLDGSGDLAIDSDNVASSIATTTPTGTLISVYDNGGALVVQESDIQAAQSGYTFTNGITETSGEVELGGTLSETTTISGNSQVFNLIGLSDLNLGATTVDFTGAVTMSSTLDVTSNIDGNGTLDILGATSLRSTLTVTGNTDIVNGTLDVGGVLTLDSVAAGSTTDDVLTITSTGEVQKISASSLGEDNNVYAMTVVTTDVTLTTGSTYVQLVSGATSGLTITLPASPIDGQVFRIKDAAGVALTYSITIAGNGNNIDNSSTSASLNTDGGALELVYNNTLGSWYVFSFVN